MVSFTLITPTYNRAHTLDRVFNSLARQTFNSFEWIIIDDGSTDNTKSIVKNYIERANFPIKYFYKENGGKHRAVNFALDHASGEFTIIADSDDEFIPDTLQSFSSTWQAFKGEHEELCGIKCYVKTHKGRLYNKGIGQAPLIVDFSTYLKIEGKNQGEGWFCIRTDIMKQNRFKEFEGEPFIPESTVWNKILKQYKIIYLPKALRIYFDNEVDSLCHSVFGMARTFNSPNGYLLYLTDCLTTGKKGLSFARKIRLIINLSRVKWHAKQKKRKIYVKQPLLFRLGSYLLSPLGFILYKRDQYKLAKVKV